MRRPLATLASFALLVAACGAPPAATENTTPNPTSPATTAHREAAGGVPHCDDVPLIEAPPEAYSDTPKYVGNEMPVDKVRQWASSKPGFEGIWIDREHNGWVTVAFSQDADQRQVEIRDKFSDDGVVVVEVDWTEERLSALQQRVIDELTGVVPVSAVGSPTNYGVVTVYIDVLTEEAIAEVEALFAGEPICVEGLDPADAVEPGPQPEAGDGWRLLIAEHGVGHVYRTGIAWDRESLEDMITTVDFMFEIPEVDFETEVAIWLGAVYGSSCPNLRLDDVIVEDLTIYPLIVNPDNPGVCTDDANPYTFIVALDRERLPAPPFHIQLDANEPPAGAPEERTVVEADLREPGSTAAPEEVGFDPNLGGPTPDRSGTVIEPGFPWDYVVDLACGFEHLGEINSYQWVASEPIPDSWTAATEESSEVTVELVLHEGDPEPSVDVTFAGETVTYRIGDDTDC